MNIKFEGSSALRQYNSMKSFGATVVWEKMIEINAENTLTGETVRNNRRKITKEHERWKASNGWIELSYSKQRNIILQMERKFSGKHGFKFPSHRNHKAKKKSM